MFSLPWGVCLIVLIASWTLSSNVNPYASFALVNDLVVRFVLSTKQVPVCNFGVHWIRLVFSPLQNPLNSPLLKQLPLSVWIVRGVPLSEQYFFKNLKIVRKTVFLQTCVIGHLLKRSIATKIHTSPRILDLIGSAKSCWVSWFGSVKSSCLFTYVSGFSFSPVALHLGQVWDFSRISRYNPGHQNSSLSRFSFLPCPIPVGIFLQYFFHSMSSSNVYLWI